MPGWLAPEDLGAHNLVAEFLHQAGLPLDRCNQFAEQVRKVERTYGLPDPEAPNAGRQLRESLLDTLEGAHLPTLQRALRGPAGGRICEVALGVVFKGESEGVNPRLALELERVFEKTAAASLRRSVHQPYLRLGRDMSSLEVVGPRQDPSLISAKGIKWVLDGKRSPTPRTGEYVAVVTDLPRVTLEVEGIVGAPSLPRTFVLKLSDRTEPFILFDAENMRERHSVGPIPAGPYWLLHESSDTLAGAEESYEWPNLDRTLSGFHLQPGAPVVLESAFGRKWRFEATYEPCFESRRAAISSASGDPIYTEFSDPPSVWIPAAEADEEILPQWSVSLLGVGVERQCGLIPTGSTSGGMIRCQVDSGSMRESLWPAMYRIELRLRRAGRSRVESRTAYWYWRGLKACDKRGFRIEGSPANLLRGDCAGFDIGENAITHRRDHRRQHKLIFDIDGAAAEFTWNQPGIFLESVERRAGEESEIREETLGSAFSASPDSCRWLRIWFAGYSDWQILIAGRIWNQAMGRDSRESVDLSLANLALAFPEGGEIRLKVGGREETVASFTSPLRPVDAERIQDDEAIELSFRFAECVRWTRAAACNLDSSRDCISEGQRLDGTGCEFHVEELPTLTCFRRDTADKSGSVVAFCVPRRGWPQGSWMIELQVRRDERSEWEEVLVHGTEYAPVFLRAGGFGLSTRSLLLSEAAGFLALPAEPNESPDDVLGLLQDLIPLRRRQFAPVSGHDMAWVKDAVHYLSRAADLLTRRAGATDFTRRLLNLACLDSGGDVFVHVPGLLALPAGQYAEVPGGDPLNDALRLCASIRRADSVVDLVREEPQFFDLAVVAHFGNFAQLATEAEHSTNADLERFAVEKYWLGTIGYLDADRLTADWEGGLGLGRDHSVWAVAQLAKRYESSDSDLASANALLNCAPVFKLWLHQKLGESVLASDAAWAFPWLRVAARADFVEKAPRFASLFALAARSSADGLLEWEEVIGWLETNAGQSRTEQGIAALVGIAPELFGHQLMFWELLVRTRPH
jgi:hypothetical protein